MKNKKVIILLSILSIIFIAGCEQQTKYVCQDGSTVSDASLCPNEVKELKKEVDRLKLEEEARKEVGSYAGSCNMGSDLECPEQGGWYGFGRIGESTECMYRCENYGCIAKECRVRK